MVTNEVKNISRGAGFQVKSRAFVQLLKMRLSMLVALSSVFGFGMASGQWSLNLLWIGLGGLFVTGSANVLNQIIERELDAKMNRTANRPLPTGVLTEGEALIYAIILAIAGVGMIGYLFNLPAALLSVIGLLSYAFVYTPLKRITPFCVFVGAIPGGLPPLIGWVAVTGALDSGGLVLFIFQFFWQFPHFWAIAWLLDEDYQRAGFKMLPSSYGKTGYSTQMILTYTICLVPLAYFSFQTGLTGIAGMIALALIGAAFVIPAYRLHKTSEDKFAKQLMFASFLYLPLIQVAFLLG